ncbi:MAG: hypothetical protein IT371_09440 [Deltaproteobacteria bacterium]|nr:hypothetical protein [Deltaproteobacteria bacterium]
MAELGKLRVSQPTLILHGGRFAEGAAEQFGRRVRRESDGRMANCAVAGVLDGAEVWREALDRQLSLGALLAAGASAGPPVLRVVLLADLTDAAVAEQVPRGVDALMGLVRGRYASLFQSYREGTQANFLCQPILLVPAPGEAWSEASRAALAQLEALHAEERWPAAVSHLYVLSESSGRYLLERDELGQMVALFLELLLCGALEGAEALRVFPEKGRDPYATFACAAAELDRGALEGYLARRTAMELLEWVRRASPERTEVAERGAEVEELARPARYRELVPLEQGRKRLDAVIETQCPDFAAAFRDVGLLEDTEELLAHYGEEWFSRQRERLFRAERELGLFRLEEVIEEVEANGVALVREERARIDRFVEERLARPAQGNVADAALSLRHLRKRLAAEEETLARRAQAPLGEAPKLDRFEERYRACAAACRKKPRRRHLVVWGLAAWGVATVCLAPLLHRVAELLALGADSRLRGWLTPPNAWGTGAALAGLGVLVYLGGRVLDATRTIRGLVGHSGKKGSLERLLQELSRGAEGSLLGYYGSRLERACDIWVHRTLVAVLKHVEDRLARLEECLAGIDVQLLSLRAAQQASGVVFDREAGEDPAGVLADRSLLRVSLLPGAELARLAATQRKPTDLPELAGEYWRTRRPLEGWESQLPFSDERGLVASCAGYYPTLLEGRLLDQPELVERARARLERFFTEVGARLDFQVDFAGRVFLDPDETRQGLATRLVVGAKELATLLPRFSAEERGGWETVATDGVRERVVLLKLVTGIAAPAIRWHAAPESGA